MKNEEFVDVFIFRQKEQKKHIFQILLFSEFHHKLQLTFAGKEIPTLPQRITSKGTTKRTKLRSDFAPKGIPKAKNGSKNKEAKTPHSDFAKSEERQPPQKIPSSVSDRKAEKQSTAKRSVGCLSEASSCASDERSFAAGPKLQTEVFLFVTFFFLPPKRKSKRRANNKQNR